MSKCTICGRRMQEPVYHMDRYHPELIQSTSHKVFRKKKGIRTEKKIVIDGNNVAYFGGKPEMWKIKQARSFFLKRGYDPIIIISSALLHNIDQRDELNRLYRIGWVRIADDSDSDDIEAIEEAIKSKCRLVSNDRFMEYREIYGRRFDFSKLIRFTFNVGSFSVVDSR